MQTLRSSGAARAALRLGLTGLSLATVAAALQAQAFERQQITTSTGTSTMRCGLAMAAKGDVLVCGAPYEDSAATDAGAVFVWRRDPATNTWALEQRVLPTDPEASARFGTSVDFDGDLLVVGAPYEDNTKGTDAGAVYVFRYSATSKTWPQEQKLTASLGAATDYLGEDVAIKGNVVVAGAPRTDTTVGADVGAAYVYRYQNSFVKWVEETRLTDGNGAGGDYMGEEVEFDGTLTIIASRNALVSGTYGCGKLNVFEYANSSWTEQAEIVPATKQNYQYFGSALDFDGESLVVSCPNYDESAGLYDTGRAYVYRRSGTTFTEEWATASPTIVQYTYFPTSVAVDGDLIVFGNQNDDLSGKSDNGSVRIARLGDKSGWVFDQQYAASDLASSDRLGATVGIVNEAFVAAAEGNDTASGTDWGVVYSYPSDEANMTVTPRAPPPGTDVTLSGFYGEPGDLCMITIEEIAGAPYFLPVLIFGFAADHTLTFTVTSPGISYGISVGFRSYRISVTGPVVRSDMAYLDI